jgi:membrane associated rhomboid family serine protease
MIPIRDQNPTSSPAVITLLLLAINIVVFLTEPIFAGGRTEEEQFVRQARYFTCRAAVPYEVTHGQLAGKAIQNGVQFETREDIFYASVEADTCPRKSVWLSIFQSMFLHGSILHIAFNMLFLWIFGNNVEDKLGKVRFTLFYFLAGIAATYAQSYVFPNSAIPLIGASGAIAGILGAYLLMFPRARIVTLVFFFFITWIVVPAWVMIGIWFLTQLVSSVGSISGGTGVAYMAHVGGFLAGMLLLLVFRPRRDEPTPAVLPY